MSYGHAVTPVFGPETGVLCVGPGLVFVGFRSLCNGVIMLCAIIEIPESNLVVLLSMI